MVKGVGKLAKALKAPSRSPRKRASTTNAYVEDRIDVNPSQFISIRRIKDRFGDDVRKETNILSVVELAVNIADLGLISAISLDRKMRLVAGRHRLSAFTLLSKLSVDWVDLPEGDLRESIKEYLLSLSPLKTISDSLVDHALMADCDAFLKQYPGGMAIPAIVQPFDSSVDEERAKFAEAAENTFRNNFTKDDLKRLNGWLLDKGYSQMSGPPRKGQKSLKSAMAKFSGKSTKTIQRFFREIEKEEIFEPKKIDEKTLQKQRSLAEAKALKSRAANFLGKVKSGKVPDPGDLKSMLPMVIEGITKSIEKLEK